MEEKDEEEQTQILFYLQNNTTVITRHHTQDIILTFQIDNSRLHTLTLLSFPPSVFLIFGVFSYYKSA